MSSGSLQRPQPAVTSTSYSLQPPPQQQQQQQQRKNSVTFNPAGSNATFDTSFQFHRSSFHPNSNSNSNSNSTLLHEESEDDDSDAYETDSVADSSDQDSMQIPEDMTPEGTSGAHPTFMSMNRRPSQRKLSIQDDSSRRQTKRGCLSTASKRIRLLILSASFLVFIAIVIVIGVINAKDGDIKLQTSFVSTIPNSNGALSNFPVSQFPLAEGPQATLCDTRDFIQMFANVSSVDTNQGRFTLHVLFFPCGKFALRDPQMQARFMLRNPTTLLFNNIPITFPSNLPMPSQDISLKFASGDPNSYPFERYITNSFLVTGTFIDTTVPGNNTALQPVPVQLNIVGALQTFGISVSELFDVSPQGTGTTLSARLQIQRSFSTKFFSVFVMGVMWLLSLLTFALSLTPWARGYKIEPPALVIGTSLLFALPALRNAQPGIPAIGCTADVVSFFWCEMLTAVSASLLLSNYIWYSHKPPLNPLQGPPPTTTEKTGGSWTRSLNRFHKPLAPEKRISKSALSSSATDLKSTYTRRPSNASSISSTSTLRKRPAPSTTIKKEPQASILKPPSRPSTPTTTLPPVAPPRTSTPPPRPSTPTQPPKPVTVPSRKSLPPPAVSADPLPPLPVPKRVSSFALPGLDAGDLMQSESGGEVMPTTQQNGAVVVPGRGSSKVFG
ncbi:hypothetical protein HDV05_007070 [Chytridiales sp. JEL 0842]|nr:hypothetical protein HDV05_007070 [Chytridiales sp. JEL 0842]